MTYSEKLKDPRWQRKRLEVMQTAGFSCQCCGESKKTLNVHHAYYERDFEPWEYPNKSLWCVCEECHTKADEVRVRLIRATGFLSPLRQHIVARAIEICFSGDESMLERAEHFSAFLLAYFPDDDCPVNSFARSFAQELSDGVTESNSAGVSE